jgi:ribonuclease HII
VTPSLRIENLLWGQGVERVAGIDEAGRGAWAGPVVAAAVVFPRRADLADLIAKVLQQEAVVDRGGSREVRGAAVVDSKELSPGQRAVADRAVRRMALGVGLGVVPARVVDEFGLSFAGQLAFWRAVWALPDPPSHLLVDGFPLWSPTYPQLAVIDGDARCLSIAAASIVAKVARDRIMRDLDCAMPGFGFAHNAGYGTPEHRRALSSRGASPEHRRTYRPVLSVLDGLDE